VSLGSGGAPVSSLAEIERLAGHHEGPRLVYVDGAFAADLSDAGGLGPTATDGALVRVAEGIALDAPVTVVHVGATSASHPRTTIELEAGASATVIEAYVGLAPAHVADARTDVRVEAGASLTRYRLVHEGPEAEHTGHTQVTQAAGSTVRTWSLLAGAVVACDAVDVSLQGAGADVDLAGLYLPVGHQRHDIGVTVEHAGDDGTSRQRFRGVVDDAALGTFNGRIVVGQGTHGNDAAQLNRCLLLTSTAEADSRPWLEIFADDVRCTHGATVGQLDEDALFYLRSRGIPRAAARRLLIAGFVDELVGDIDVATVRALVADVVTSTGGGR
jgi:Fe-S cluster assembly protein SufD